VIVGEPVQVPGVHANVFPTATVPAATGAIVFTGLLPLAVNAFEIAVVDPVAFVAVT
jgi:hypothetical protein